MTLTLVELFFVLFCGLCFGSFVTLVSYRLPLGEDIVVKPSRCPKCDTPLQFLDLWPVVSWVMSKGACRHCKSPVSFRYPLIEIITGSMFVFLYLRYGFTPVMGVLAMTWVALMVMIVVDFEHYIIPDAIQITLMILGLLYHYLVGTNVETVLEGFLLGGAIGLFLHHGYRAIRKKEGLGFGDVKFLAVAGLWLGMVPMVPFLFLSGVLGVVTGLVWRALGNGAIFPFGPSLALSFFLCVLFPGVANMFWYIGQMAQ